MRNIGKMKKMNNKGFSLLELLIAMAILAVIAVTLVQFMGSSSKTYTKTSAEATVQSEAQIVANAISDRIIDCEVNLNYVPQGDAKDVRAVINNLSGTNLGSETDGSILQVSNTLMRFALVLDRDKKVIYYIEQTRTDPAAAFANYNYNDKQVLAQNVKDFSVNIDRYATENIIYFELAYEKNENPSGGYKKEYRSTYQVYLRNHIKINEDDKIETSTTTNIDSITIGEYYVNLIGGVPKADPTSSIRMAELNVSATVKPAAMGVDGITWEAHGEPLTNKDLNGDGTNGGVDDVIFTMAAGDSNVTKVLISSNPQVEESDFVEKYMISASKGGVSNTGVIKIRKVTEVVASPADANLKLADDTRSDIYTFKSTQNSTGTVTARLKSSVTGWNLSSNNKNVTWALRYKLITEPDSAYKVVTDSSIASIAASSNNYASVTFGNKATTSLIFEVVATSTFDNTKISEPIYLVLPTKTTDLTNKTFARGVDIDLANYIAAYGLDKADKKVDNFISASVKNVPGMNDSDPGSAFPVTDGNLFVDADYVNAQYYDLTRLKSFYKELSLSTDVTYDGYDGSEYKYNYTYENHFTLPAVEVYRANSELLDKIHAWNNATSEERANNIKNGTSFNYTTDTECKTQMINLNQNVVIAKGSTKALYFYTQAFNITAKNLISAYVDMGKNSRGHDLNSTADANSNEYITASLTSGLGNRSKLMDYGVVTLKAKNNKVSRHYPLDPFKINIGVRNYYLLYTSEEIKRVNDANLTPRDLSGTISITAGETVDKYDNGQQSFTYYNIYIANVEGKTLYIPGPGSKVWRDNKYESIITTGEKEFTLGPANSRVKIYKDTNGAYKMKYNSSVYVFNTTYNYWQEV